MDLLLPGFDRFSLNTYYRKPDGITGKAAGQWQINPTWAMTLPLGRSDILFDGYLEWYVNDVGRKGTSNYVAKSFHFNPQIKYDVGKALGYTAKRFYAGVEWDYWSDKYGIEDSHGFPTDQNALSVLFKAHFNAAMARACSQTSANRALMSLLDLLRLLAERREEDIGIPIAPQADHATSRWGGCRNRLIASRDEVLVCHMNLRNAGRLASNSGQLSGKSGRDRPRFNSVLSRTRQNRSGAERSIQINMSARASRLFQVVECPPSKIQRSRASTSWQRRVFSSRLRSTHPGCQ